MVSQDTVTREEPTAAAAQPKRSRWRSVANRAMGGSLVASGVSQVVLIVSGVLVARSLGPQDRGYLALLVVVSGICSLLGSLGLPSAATYYIARDRSHARPIASSLLVPAVLLAAVTLVLQIAVLVPLVMHDPRRVKVAAVISLLLVPGLRAFAYGTAILQGQQRFTAFNVTRILPTIAYVAAVMTVFALHTADLVLLTTMWTMANLFGGLFALAIAVRGLPRPDSPSRPPSRSEVTRFGMKSLFSSLSPVDAFRLDQAAVGLFLNPVALGLYVVAQAFTNLPRIIGYSIGLVAYPQVAAQPDRAAARRAMWRYFFIGVALSLLVVGALEVATGTLVTLFFGSDFSGAAPTARILLIGTLFMAARRVLTDGVNGLGYPGVGTVAEVSSWVLLVPGFAILLPKLGLTGAALALAFSWGASLLLMVALVLTIGTRLWPGGLVVDARKRIHRMGLLSYEQLVVSGLTVAASVGAGVVVAVSHGHMNLAMIVALLATLFFAYGRATLARVTRLAHAEHAKRVSHETPESSSDPERAPFRLARFLFYAGLLLLAVLTLRASGQLALSDVLFFFSFVFACAELVIVRRRVSIALPMALMFGMALFSLGGLVSTFESYAAVKSIAVVARIIFLTVFWFWLATLVLNRREHVNRAMTLWVASAALCGFAAVAQLLGVHLPFAGALQFGRSTGFSTQPNELGGIEAIAFVPALMLASRPHAEPRQRVISYFFVFLVGGGLILSGSVGGILAALAGTYVWLALQRSTLHSRRVFATVALLIVAVVMVQTMRGGATPLQRLTRVTQSSSSGEGAGSVDSRIATYRVAVKQIKKDPFIGVGLDLISITKPFGVVSYEFDVHNLIIGIWYKAGLFGLIGMLIALGAVLRTGWRAVLESVSDTERMCAVALLSSFVAFFAFAMSEPVLYARFGWISAALVLVLRAVQVREARVAVAEVHNRSRHELVLAPARS